MNIAEEPGTIKRALAVAAVLVMGIGACSTVPMDQQADSTAQAAGFARIGNLVVNGVPDIPEEVRSLLLPYENARSAQLAGWTDDGLLISTRFAETNQVHHVATAGASREQLTFFDEPVAAVYVPPHRSSEGFAYLRDVGGSEFYQLFWYDRHTGTSTLLTDGHSRNSALRWSNRGDQFAYTTTRRNGTNSDIHVRKLQGDDTAVVQTQGGSWSTLDWSPGDDKLLVQEYLSINQSNLYEVDLGTGEMTALFDQTLNAAFGAALYDPSGGGIYLTSDMGAEFMRLHHLDLASGELTVVTGDIPWNVEQFLISPDGQTLAFMINEGGFSRIYAWRLPNRSLIALPMIPAGIIGRAAFSEDSRHLALSINRASSPSDVYSIDLLDRRLVRWTQSEVGGLDPRGFVEPELISYPTFDQDEGVQRQIPAFVYRPAGAGPHPVVISIHGGPEAQYRPYFSSVIQSYVTGLGAAVIAPNVRGSDGYGKSYLKLDNGFLREDSVKDIGALLEWIKSDPGLDSSRVVVMGGSYGGYMVLASMVHYSDQLVAGVERVGISNWVTFLENTQGYRRDLRRVEYGDEREPAMREYLERISPLNQISRMTRPLYIAQGFNDPRVPASESEQIFSALKSAGVPVWYVVALDEGHGFRKKVNIDFDREATLAFLQQYLF